MECDFVTTKRGARSLLQGGFKYTLNRRGREGQIYWRCVDRKCPGRAVTDQLVSANNQHCHPPDDVAIKVAKVVERMETRGSSTTGIYGSRQQTSNWRSGQRSHLPLDHGIFASQGCIPLYPLHKLRAPVCRL